MKGLAKNRTKTLVALTMTALIWVGWSAISGSGLGARANNSWLAAQPTLGPPEAVAGGQLPESLAFAGNIPCQTTRFNLRPAVPLGPPAETAQACAVSTPPGRTAPGGYTSMFKADARLFDSSGGPVNFYPMPDSPGGIVLENTAQGQRLHYYRSGLLSARRQFDPATKEMRAYLPTAPTWTLKDKAGKIIYVRPDSPAFSNNGRWMVVDAPMLATLLVNLETGEIVPFGAPYVYHMGLSVMPHLAVSDDGQTVITASDRGDFRVVDIESCNPVPASITGPVTCNFAQHENYLKTQIPGFLRAYQIRFLNDRLVSFYAHYDKSPTNRVLAKYKLAPHGDALETQDYLALGDSFTSGEGAYDYFPETDNEANMCHLSHQSYPYLIGRQLDLASFGSVACSGARVQDITTYAQKSVRPAPNHMGDRLPGLKKQLQYIKDRNPSIITIGVGGNDIGFGSILKQCVGYGVVASTCFESYEDRLELVRQINKQFQPMADMLTQVKTAARVEARVYAVGYPRLAKAEGNCAFNVRLSSPEIVFSNQVIDYLNKIISLAADRAGVAYVDVADAFSGYRLCEIDGKHSAMNGLTAGDNRFGLLGNESYHPNQRGHMLYKQAIIARTDGLARVMPAPNRLAQPPPADSGLDILVAPRTNRPVKEVISDEAIVSDVVARGQTIVVKARFDEHFLQPRSAYQVQLRSNPMNLGSFMTDDDGGVDARVTIPTDVDTGFHGLHILATDVTGAAVDIYKTVYVVDTGSDTGGYGITRNTNDTARPANDTAPTQYAEKRRQAYEASQTGPVKSLATIIRPHSIDSKAANLVITAILLLGVMAALINNLKKRS